MRGKWSECFLGIAGAIGPGNLKSCADLFVSHGHISETIIDIGTDRLDKEDQIPFFFGENTDKEVVEGIRHAGILAFNFHIVVVITLGHQGIGIGDDQTSIGTTIDELRGLIILS